MAGNCRWVRYTGYLPNSVPHSIPLVMADLDSAKARAVRLGRLWTDANVEAAIRTRLAAGEGFKKVAKAVAVGNSTVSRIKAEMRA